MVRAVKRPYDNTRRQAQVRATRLRIIEAAKALFTDRGYPATTLEAIAAAADTSLPTLYRLFASKPALLKAVLDVSFGGDDQPIAFGDRPEVQKARAESDPVALIRAFARIGREFMERSSAIMHVLATAAQVDPDAGQLMEEIRQQRHAGQSRIVGALSALEALDPDLEFSNAVDMTYLSLSPDIHRILTVERGWTANQYEQWLIRSLGLLLRPELRTTRRRPLRDAPLRQPNTRITGEAGVLHLWPAVTSAEPDPPARCQHALAAQNATFWVQLRQPRQCRALEHN